MLSICEVKSRHICSAPKGFLSEECTLVNGTTLGCFTVCFLASLSSFCPLQSYISFKKKNNKKPQLISGVNTSLLTNPRKFLWHLITLCDANKEGFVALTSALSCCFSSAFAELYASVPKWVIFQSPKDQLSSFPLAIISFLLYLIALPRSCSDGPEVLCWILQRPPWLLQRLACRERRVDPD